MLVGVAVKKELCQSEARPADELAGELGEIDLSQEGEELSAVTPGPGFIDPKSGQLIWHGWTTEPAPQTTRDENRNLRTAVENVLDKFPPK